MPLLHRNLRALALAALAPVVLAACTSTPVITPQGYIEALMADTGQDGEACIEARRINDFRSLNSSSVVSVSTTDIDKHYIAATRYRCDGMSTSSLSTFRSSRTELCGSGRDAFLTRTERCTIGGIFVFDSRDAMFAAWRRVNSTLREDPEELAAGE